MDHYPEVNILERECPREDWASSRHHSDSSDNKASIRTSLDEKSDSQESLPPPQYTSFPTPSIESEEKQHSRSDSVHEISNDDAETKAEIIEAVTALYADAPPPYSKKQYEGKSEEQKRIMRMRDYARALSRMMGRQLVSGLNRDAQE